MFLHRCIHINIVGNNGHQVAFKNCSPQKLCITIIDAKTIDDAEDLDLVMPMYYFLEYSWNYSNTTGSLQLYSTDEATNFNDDIGNIKNFKYFKYKTKSLGDTVADGNNGILKDSNRCTIKLSK